MTDARRLRALPTSYAGVMFRSRTEARWAMAFDLVGERWEYEPEGFALPSGPYLPDFYLPDHDCYAEIKGKAFTDAERDKCIDLATATGRNVLMLDGTPAWRWYWMVVAPSESPAFADPIFGTLGGSRGVEVCDVLPFWPVSYREDSPRGLGGGDFWISTGRNIDGDDIAGAGMDGTWAEGMEPPSVIRQVRAHRWA